MQINPVSKIAGLFFEADLFPRQSLWFKRALYVAIIFSCLYWLMKFDMLFGEHAIVYRSSSTLPGWRNIAYLLYYNVEYVFPAIILSATLAFCPLLLSRSFFLFDLILALLVINIHNAIYPSLTGGDFLLNQFLLFNCGISFCKKVLSRRFASLRRFLHNFCIIAVMLQVCLLYFISGLTKLGDESWRSGNAILLTLQAQHFGYGWGEIQNIFIRYMFVGLNYLVISYQLLFPLLIWIRPLKKPLIAFGVLMHLYIAFGMGLVGFGLVMVLSYVYFWPINSKFKIQSSKAGSAMHV